VLTISVSIRYRLRVH